MAELPNSSRTFLKATYSRIDAPRAEPMALAKLAFARDLAVSEPEAKVLASRADAGGDEGVRQALALAVASTAGFGTILTATRLAGRTSADDLLEFGQRVAQLRDDFHTAAQPVLAGLQQDTQNESNAGQPSAWSRANSSEARQALREVLPEELRELDPDHVLPIANTQALVDQFTESRGVEPVAWLHLERIETTPVGVERGELVATVPMAPGEKTFVSHKEWATHSSEFQDIVVDELESYSERGVVEKTDVAMGNESESKRDSTLNFGVSVSGSYGPVSMTSSLNTTSADSERETRTQSTKHAVEQTSKASSRVRKEHKVSMRVETRSGTEDVAAKEIVNSTDKAVRIDYYRMMRKWRVDLIRYGLRMTYDLVVPEPGSALRRVHAELARLKAQIGPFEFSLRHDEITPLNYQVLADRHDAQVPPVPAPGDPVVVSAPVSGLQGASGGISHFPLPFDVEQGYRVRQITLDGVVSSPEAVPINLDVLGSTFHYSGGNVTLPSTVLKRRGEPAGGNFLEHATGHQTILFVFQGADVAAVQLTVDVEPTPSALEQWRTDVWNALYNAAQSRYYADQQTIAAKINDLQESLDRDDTLTLRRAEREELMKRTLQWLFGPDFDVTPPLVSAAIEQARADDSQLSVDGTQWLGVREFGEFVKFLHQAIEWENVLYFLYPYFWGVGQQPDDLRLLWHADPARREFLKAGAARVVLPVRPGFEIEFARFMEEGVLSGPGSGTTYLTIAEEMQAFARTNYGGIPRPTRTWPLAPVP